MLCNSIVWNGVAWRPGSLDLYATPPTPRRPLPFRHDPSHSATPSIPTMIPPPLLRRMSSISYEKRAYSEGSIFGKWPFRVWFSIFGLSAVGIPITCTGTCATFETGDLLRSGFYSQMTGAAHLTEVLISKGPRSQELGVVRSGI